MKMTRKKPLLYVIGVYLNNMPFGLQNSPAVFSQLMEKVLEGFDCARSLSGNRYIISFICIYTGYPECYAVPDKNAENIVPLLLEEIIRRHSVPLQLLSDNGSENVARIVKETLAELNISHVTTSYYSPSSYGKVERFHRFLHDVLAKKIKDDIHLRGMFI